MCRYNYQLRIVPVCFIFGVVGYFWDASRLILSRTIVCSDYKFCRNSVSVQNSFFTEFIKSFDLLECPICEETTFLSKALKNNFYYLNYFTEAK